jgi:hypothetical protein
MPNIPVHQRGYAHPELLAETDWLAQHLEDPNVASSTLGHRNNMPPVTFPAR